MAVFSKNEGIVVRKSMDEVCKTWSGNFKRVLFLPFFAQFYFRIFTFLAYLHALHG